MLNYYNTKHYAEFGGILGNDTAGIIDRTLSGFRQGAIGSSTTLSFSHGSTPSQFAPLSIILDYSPTARLATLLGRLDVTFKVERASQGKVVGALVYTGAHACWNAREGEKGKAVAWVKEEQQIAHIKLEGHCFLVEPGWISVFTPAELEFKESLDCADSPPELKRLQAAGGGVRR